MITLGLVPRDPGAAAALASPSCCSPLDDAQATPLAAADTARSKRLQSYDRQPVGFADSSPALALAVLRRQARQLKLTRADRALLVALSRFLPRVAWAGFPVKPGTLLRWHRQLVARRWRYAHRAPGRPPLESSLRALIVRLGHENPDWGYKRIVGELKGLGIAVSATSVRKVLLAEGLQPAPERSHSSWRAFLRAQAGSMLACDFLTVETAAITTSTGRTARSTSSHPTAATPRLRTRPIVRSVGISSGDSSTNASPPGFANPPG